MILWHKNLVKMKVNKLILSYSTLIKLQSPLLAKKTFIKGTQQKNFSLSSCFFYDKSEITAFNVSSTGVEQVSMLQRISKKKNKLSKVEEKDFVDLNRCLKGDVMYPYNDTIHRAKDILMEDLKVSGRNTLYFLTRVKTGSLKPERFSNETDILILGGGAVGLSVAYSIRNQFPHGPKVTVVDKDDSIPHLSTNLGQGLVSIQQFNEEEEIEILKYGAEFFSAFPRNTEINKDIQYKLDYDPLGSLLLVDKSNMDKVMRNHELLKKFKVNNNVLLDKQTLEKKFPWLNTDNILFGSLGMYGEGIINPWTYIYGLRRKCESLGVNFVTGEIIDFGYEGDNIIRAICKLPNGSYNFIDFAYLVLAGGLESLNIVDLFNESDKFELGLNLPLEERMRYEYCFYNSNGPGLNTPIIFNPDGTYFRREGLTNHYVAGVPSVVYNEGNDEESLPYHVFDRVVKPFLIQRMPNLKKIDLTKGWIDVYDFCTANNVGITGPHPSSQRVIFALGFSHLGLQYLPALGRGIMEYLIYNTYQTINFEPFHVENLWRKQHLEADRKRKELLEAQERVAISE